MATSACGIGLGPAGQLSSFEEDRDHPQKIVGWPYNGHQGTNFIFAQTLTDSKATYSCLSAASIQTAAFPSARFKSGRELRSQAQTEPFQGARKKTHRYFITLWFSMDLFRLPHFSAQINNLRAMATFAVGRSRNSG
ncbi:hypothetical protein SBA6_500009 [Candidatus Sulfopaludibacter sp. SbA6]|nr:hypothetical protein SBA6_500009 [Candidatus Sulfopaludibacter sp. SbA6]